MNGFATRGATRTRRGCALIAGLVAAAVAWVPGGAASGAVIWKNSSSGNLNLTSSWWTTEAGTTNPGSIGTTDTLWFGGTSQAASGTWSLGGNMTVGALRLDNGASATNYNVTINSGNTLTLNGNTDYNAGFTSGIVLNGAAGGTMTINCDVTIGNSQRWVTSRNLTVNGNVSLGANTLTLHVAGATQTLSGTIAGTGGISVQYGAGGGVALLSGTNNSYSGLTRLLASTLQVAKLANGGANSSIGASTNAAANLLFNGGALSYVGTGDTTDRSFTITANPLINANGSGALTWSGASPAFGAANTAYNVRLSGTSTSDNTWGTVLPDNGTGAISLLKQNTGKWIITGANTYTGSTMITQGTLRVNGSGVLGGAAGSTTDASNITFDSGNSNAALEFETSANLGAAGQIRFRNSGGTAGSGGVLRYVGTTSSTVSKTIQCDTSIGVRLESDSVGGAITFNGAFDAAGRALYLGGSGTGDNTLAMVFSGNGGITKRDAGTWLLSATNTYTGVTTLSGGELKVSTLANGGANSAIGASGTAAANLVFSGGTLTYVGSGHSTNRAFTISSAPTINASGAGALTWSGTTAFTTGNTAYTITLGGTSTADNTWSTVLADNGTGATALTKTGAGKWVISGVNTYSGVTTVSAGTLAFGGNNSLGSNLAGSAGSVVSFGANTITIGNSTAGDSNGTYSGKLDGTGTVSLRGGSISVVDATTGASGTTGNAFFVSVTTANMPTSAFALDTGASASDRKDFGYVNSTGDVLTLSSLSGFGSIRSDSGGSSSMRFITVNQAGDTTFNGAVTSNLSGGGVVRALTLEKTGAGSLTLAGFVGKQTLSGSAGAAPVNLVANGGLLLVTNTFNSTTTNTDAINTSGTVTITSGTLGFAPQALISNAGTGLASILMNGGVLRWHGTNTQDMTVGGKLALVAGKTATFDTNLNDVTLATALGGGAISGAVTKIGGGTLTMSASNAYSGGTVLSVGALRAGNDAAFGTGTVTLNAGSLSSADTNARVLANALAIGADVALGDATNTGALTFSGGVDLGGAVRQVTTPSNVTFAGAVTSGGLTKAGAAMLTLSGSNTYAAGTTISGGTLRIGGGGATGSVAGNVTNNAALAFDRSDAMTFSGTIAGTGAVTKLNSNELTLNAVNSYSGNTTISSGTLVVGGAGQLGSGAYAGAIANSGALRFTTSANQTLSGGVTGVGSLAKSGAGRLTLLGNNTYSGPTTVDAGTLVVNGVVTSSTISVSSGGILGGSGTAATVALAGGVVSPGNSPGTLSVSDMSWDATSSYKWEIYDYQAGAGTGWDQIVGTGGLTVTGTGFTFNLVSLSGTNTPGPAFNWSQTASGTFRLATFAGGITTPGGTWYTINTGSFTPFDPNTGAFSIATGGTTIDLVFTYTAPSLWEWTAGSGQWSGAGNWAQATTPSGTAALVFSGSGGTSTNDLAPGTLGLATGLTFSGSASGSYTVDGAAITLGSLGIVNSSTATQTVATGLTLATTSLANADTAALVLSGTIDTAGYAFTVTGSYGTTLSGVLTGSGSLVKTNPGTLTLTGANDYTGGTTITGGTVVVGNGATAGVLPGNVTNNAAVVFDRSDAVTFGGSIAGTGSVTKLKSNTLTLTGSNGYTGGTTITGGTLVVGDGATSGVLSGNVTNNAALVFDRSDASTFAGAIAGTGAVAKVNAGTLTLTGSSGYTGGTTITGGTLRLGAGGTTGSIAGDVTNDAALAFDRSDAVTFGGAIGGTGSVTKLNTNALTLTATSTYTGNTTIAAGTLVLGGAGRLGGGSYAGAIANAGVLSVETSANQTLSGTVSGVGSLRMSGGGALTLTAANTYSGSTTLTAGTIRVGNDAALGTGTAALAGGALSSDGGTARTLANAVAIGGNVTLGDATNNGLLTFTGNVGLEGAVRQVTTPSNVTISGTVSNGGLTKAGSGVLTLTAANTHTLGTTLSAGTILVGNNAALGTGTATLDGGTLSSDGGTARTLANALVIGGDLTLGDATRNGPLTFSGNVGLGDAVRQLTLPSDVTLSGTVANGGLTKVGAGTLRLSGSSTYTLGTTLVSGSIVAANSGALGASGTVTLNTAATGASNTGLLIDAGAGSVTIARPISVANQGSGVTTIGSGSLASTNQATFSGPITLAKDVTLVAATSGDRTQFTGGIGGTGSVTVTTVGTGRVIFVTASNSFSGNVTISPSSRLQLGDGAASTVSLIPDSADVTIGAGGRLQLSKAVNNETINTLLGSGTVEVNNNTAGQASTLIVGSAGGSGTFSGVLSDGNGVLGFTKQGAGTQVLGGNNSYTGVTTVTSGTLVVGDGGTSGSIGGNVANSSMLVFNRSDSVTYAGVISGAGSFTKDNSNTLTLTGVNTYSGATTISSGTLEIGNGGNIGSAGTGAPGNVVTVSSGATLLFNRAGLLDNQNTPRMRNVAGSGSIVIASGTFVNYTGAGTGFADSNSWANFSGGLFVRGGAEFRTIRNGATAMGTGTVTLGDASSSGSLSQFDGNWTWTNAIALVGSANQILNRGTGSGRWLKLQGVIGGAGNLTIGDPAGAISNPDQSIVLTGANTMSGTLTIDTLVRVGGVTGDDSSLSAGAGGTLGTATVVINSGKTLTFSRSDAVVIPNTIGGAGLVRIGSTGIANSSAQNITLSGSNTYTGGTELLTGTLQVNALSGIGTFTTGSTGYLAVKNGATFVYAGSGSETTTRNLVLDTGTATITMANATGSLTWNDSATKNQAFTKTGPGSLEIGGIFSGSAQVTANGGLLTLAGVNTYTGTTTVSSGTLRIGGSGQLGSGAYAGSIVNAATFDYASSANQTLSGTISGLGVLAKTGAGALTLSASNSYSGGTTLSAGSLLVGNNSALGSGTVTLNGGAFSSNSTTARSLSNPLVLGGTVTLGDATNNGLLTFSGPVDLGGAVRTLTMPSNATIAGAVTNGGITKTGSGTLTLSNGANTFGGGTTISAGVVSFAAGGLGSSSNVTLADATTLQWASGNTQDVSSRLVLPDSGGVTLDSGANAVTLTSGLGAGSSAGLTKAGAGSLILTASNGYTGVTTVSGGTLALAGAGSIAASSGLNLSSSGATFDISGAGGDRAIGPLSGAAGSVIRLGDNTLSAIGDNTTFGGVISGSGGFTKTGVNQLTLTAVHDFTGRLAVNEGLLTVSGSNLLQTAESLYVASGAVLNASAAGLTVYGDQKLGGYGTVDGGVTFLANSLLSPGGSVGALTNDGATTFNGPFTYDFDLNDADGAAGGPAGWDLYTASSFAFNGFNTTTNRFVVNLISLSGSTPNLDATDFNPAFNYAWKFLVASDESPISVTNGWFQVATTNFKNSLGENPGTFYVARGDELGAIGASGENYELYVVYAAVPEPGTLGLAGIGLAAALLARRRRPARVSP